MIEQTAVELSRIQFALTALYHFLFVPLTLGLSFLLAIMESVYVMTNKPIWRSMTKFWGVLFGINFAMGVATGLTMEFQFGTNWAYFSYYVGDVFGSLLAIEGLMAFFLEASLIGLFFFGWQRLSKVAHLGVTWFLALATNFSALWILIANGWMQNPIGAKFNPQTLRMEMTSFYDVLFNPVAQAKFVHTVSAGYVTGSVFVLAISAYYLLNGRHLAFAKRSMTVAASFGLAAALSVVVLGDESGYTATRHQQLKIAAIEGLWETKPAPAPLVLFGIPDQQTHTTKYEVEVPWLLGLIATRSFDHEVLGINDLVRIAEERMGNGIKAYKALEVLRKDPNDLIAKQMMELYGNDLGHALLLKKTRDDIENATVEEKKQTAWNMVPNVGILFWSFRIMAGVGFLLIALFATSFYFASRDTLDKHRWFLKAALFSLPLPWIAAELGWVVAEYGRQPWSIDGILPTFIGASSVAGSNIVLSILGFVVFYSVLAVVDVVLLVKYIRLGPTETLGLEE